MAAKSTLSLYVSEDTLTVYKWAVVDVFQDAYDNLRSVLENSMTSFSGNAYSAGLISSHVMRTKNFEGILQEFTSGLKMMKNVLEVQKHCQILIKILEDIRGPAAIAGRNLTQKLSALSGTCIYIISYKKIVFSFNCYQCIYML